MDERPHILIFGIEFRFYASFFANAKISFVIVDKLFSFRYTENIP